MILIEGTMHLGLKDLRKRSPTYNQIAVITINGQRSKLINIPTGVGHCFYYPCDSVLIYGISQMN